MARYLRYVVYECTSEAGGGSCKKLRTFIDGGEALAYAVRIAHSGKTAQIEIYEKKGG